MQGYMHINDHDASDDSYARIPNRWVLPVLADLQKYEWMFWWRMTNTMKMACVSTDF